MLHRAWSELLRGWSVPHVNRARKDADLARPEMLGEALPPGTRLLINCAAWTDVDGAEAHEGAATQVNGAAVGALARLCHERGIFLVHYSTDYVFNGRATSPYAVDTPRDPVNAYGRSKAAGEEALERAGCRHLLIRTSWLYAPWGKNFVRTMARLLKNPEAQLRVVNDQRGRPTSCELLALNSARLIDASAEGTFHLTDAGECTWHEFTLEIGRRVNPSKPVAACTSAEFGRPAPRPAYSVLDISRSEQVLGRLTPWEDALADVLNRLE
jgi:dTDP-4-dehydrorhamnose reductase